MAASFPATRIEGGLLGPDLFDQLLNAELSGQKPADFGLDAEHEATVHGQAVDEDRTRPAVAVVAAFLGAGEPDDVARPVAFLASAAAAMITGHTLLVDGGYTIH